MKNKITVANIFLLVLILLLGLLYLLYKHNHHPKSLIMQPAQPTTQPTTAPIPTQLSQHPLALHTAIPYWVQDEAFASFSKNVSKFEYVSLFWYFVSSDQEVLKYTDAKEDTSIIDFAHQHNIKVFALITNLPESEGSDWDSDRIRPILASPKTRAKHINDLVNLVESKNFDGINIDYEQLDADLKDPFSTFIHELTVAMHARGKLVSVALHPKSGENISIEDNGSRAQDWKSLTRDADQLYLMAYGEHWDTSTAGPIASIPWDEKIIAYAKKLQLPMNKLFLGTPLYATRWAKNEKNGEGLTFKEVMDLEATYGVQPVWDDKAKSPSVTYSHDGEVYNVWYENSQSVEEKKKLAEKTGLGGISFWNLGGEDPDIWHLF